ncbi:MAG: cyclophilin-like fold protein, partial [Desulfobacteria bacterium]
MKPIRIILGNLTLDAQLNDSPTAQKIWEALPIETSFSTWGDEIYFSIPVAMELDSDAQEVVQSGDLGYWPSGNAFCIFFGLTPISSAGEIRPASAVNMIGRVIDDATKLKEGMSENLIRLERK